MPAVVGITQAQHLDWIVRWESLVFAVLSLTVLRMLPVALCLLGTGLRWPTVLFVGWFGPRGVASVETQQAAEPLAVRRSVGGHPAA